MKKSAIIKFMLCSSIIHNNDAMNEVFADDSAIGDPQLLSSSRVRLSDPFDAAEKLLAAGSASKEKIEECKKALSRAKPSHLIQQFTVEIERLNEQVTQSESARKPYTDKWSFCREVQITYIRLLETVSRELKTLSDAVGKDASTLPVSSERSARESITQMMLILGKSLDEGADQTNAQKTAILDVRRKGLEIFKDASLSPAAQERQKNILEMIHCLEECLIAPAQIEAAVDKANFEKIKSKLYDASVGKQLKASSVSLSQAPLFDDDTEEQSSAVKDTRPKAAPLLNSAQLKEIEEIGADASRILDDNDIDGHVEASQKGTTSVRALQEGYKHLETEKDTKRKLISLLEFQDALTGIAERNALVEKFLQAKKEPFDTVCTQLRAKQEAAVRNLSDAQEKRQRCLDLIAKLGKLKATS